MGEEELNSLELAVIAPVNGVINEKVLQPGTSALGDGEAADGGPQDGFIPRSPDSTPDTTDNVNTNPKMPSSGSQSNPHKIAPSPFKQNPSNLISSSPSNQNSSHSSAQAHPFETFQHTQAHPTEPHPNLTQHASSPVFPPAFPSPNIEKSAISQPQLSHTSSAPTSSTPTYPPGFEPSSQPRPKTISPSCARQSNSAIGGRTSWQSFVSEMESDPEIMGDVTSRKKKSKKGKANRRKLKNKSRKERRNRKAVSEGDLTRGSKALEDADWRNISLQNEEGLQWAAKEIWNFGRLIGIIGKGNDKEVLMKLAEMEARDREKAMNQHEEDQFLGEQQFDQ